MEKTFNVKILFSEKEHSNFNCSLNYLISHHSECAIPENVGDTTTTISGSITTIIKLN